MSGIKCEPELNRVFKGHRGQVNTVHLSRHSNQIASGGNDGHVFIWHYGCEKRAFRFVGHEKPVNRVWFCPSRNQVLSASADSTVRIWKNTIKGENSVLYCHSPVNCVEASAQHILTAANDKTLKLWDFNTLKFIRSFTGHRNWVNWAGFNPAGNKVISGGDDCTVKIWDATSGKAIKSLDGLIGRPTTVSFQPNSEQCVAASFIDGFVRLWDVRTYRLLQLYHTNGSCIQNMVFHPSGNLILIASSDASLRILDLFEGRVAYTIEGHKYSANCVDSSGKYFASGGTDEKVILWKTNFDMNPVVISEDVKGSDVRPLMEIKKIPDVALTPSPSPYPLLNANNPPEIPVLSMDVRSKENIVPSKEIEDSSKLKQKMEQDKIEKLTSSVDFLNQKVSLLEQKLTFMTERLDSFVALFDDLSQDHD